MNKTKRIRNLTIVAVTLLILGYFSFGNFNRIKSTDKTVTIGLVAETKQEQKIWQQVAKTAKEKYNLTLKFKQFTDYTQPNQALVNGDIDLNSFQHYDFLNSWNKSNDNSLVSIGRTFITPVRVFSNSVQNLNDLPNGATISIPNDSTNESRALFVLKNAGLINFKPHTDQATINSIISNPKNLKFKELDASQIPRSLNDVDATVINANFAQSAGLDYRKAIYVEPLNRDSRRWVNIIVAKKSNKNNSIYKEVVKAYQTNAVKKVIKQQYGTSELPAWNNNFNKR